MSSTSAPGRYVCDRQIGRGGMATVWLAHDTVLDRPVALKRLRPALLDDTEIAERFKREAESVARLSHPGVVRMLDRGEDADGPFLVMELVEGEDLKARITRTGALPPEDARRICAQVARALAYAHNKGLIHRDIKSQNVLLDDEGNAKLTDFGIARLSEAHGDPGLTRTGMMVGSSDYLAPEQAEGKALDQRTDIYALGIVLWECLTGRLPFPGESFVSVAMRHVTDPLPDPRTVTAGIPAQLAVCAMRAAAKRPEQRFQTADSFAQALEEPGGADTAALDPVDDPWHRDQDATGRRPLPSARTRRRRAMIALAAVVGVGVVGAGTYLGVRVLHGSTPVATPAVRAAAITFTVRDYDPQGGDGESPTQVPRAYDHDPATAWYTEKYHGSSKFGGYAKTGVGLVLEASAGYRPTQVNLLGATPGAPFEIRKLGPLTGPALASGVMSDATQHLALPAGTTGPLVVWITGLVPIEGNPGYYWAGVREVSMDGVPNRGA